jgi:hypothetical protein
MIRTKTIDLGKLERPKLSRDGQTMVVSIPISMRRTGGRKKVITPANVAPWSPAPTRMDNTIVKALVRAHRWRGMLENKQFGSVRELAKAEKISESYLCRLLRLTMLSPKLTETILNGQQPEEVDLARLLNSIPIEWDKQEEALRAGVGRTKS